MERFREFMGDQDMDEEELLFAERRATIRLARGLQSWEEMQRTSATAIQALYRGVRVRRALKVKLKMHKHRTKVVKELLSTEQSYRDGLALMLEVIYTPLSWNASHSSNPILAAEELHLLFSNFVQIQSLSGQLCDLFKERIDSWYQGKLIADIFTKFGAFLKIYTVYCNHFDDANNLMQQVEQRENFRLFWEPIRQLHGVGTLGSFLIMPVQRIPRYVLLLRDLLKSTWEDHPDYENIKKALELVESIGSQVNLAMKSHEESSEMSEAQNAFGAFVTVLSPSRRFVQRGKLLLLKQATTEEVVTVWLFNDLIIISDYEEFVGGYTYKGSIQLKDNTGKSMALLQDLQDMEFIRNVFRISSGTSAFTLSAPTVEEKAKWVDALQNILGNATMLSATVLGTAQRQDAKGRYTVYVIEVTGIGGAKRRIYKRYSEFDQLDQALKQAVPELHSINLPPKRLFGQSAKELERRVVALGLYLQQLLLREDAATKELLRTFLEDYDGVLVGPPDESGDEDDRHEDATSNASSSFDTQHAGARPALLKSMSSFLGKKSKRAGGAATALDAGSPDQPPGFGRSMSSPASQESPSTMFSRSFGAPKLRGMLGKQKSRQGATFNLGATGAMGDQRVSVFLANGSTVPLTLSPSTRAGELIQTIATEISLPLEMASDFGIFICTSPAGAAAHGKVPVVIDSRPLELEEFPLRVLLARRSPTTDARLLFQKAQWFPADDQISHPTLAKLMFYQIQRDVEDNEFPCSIEDTAKMTALVAQAAHGNMNGEKAKEFQASTENLIPRFCASKNDLVTNATNVSELAGGLELRMFALSYADVQPDESGHGDFVLRLWSGTQERMPLTARALHHEDFKRWTAALSEKVMGAPVEEGDPAMTAKLRDAATAAPVTSPELFQQVARGYVSGAQSATAEGWMTKPSRSGSAKGWKLRWFVVVDRYLLYFKQRPKMRLNADHWRGMLNAHWRSFNGYSLDQVHTTYLQIAQEYPFYGCTCFSVVFDKNASPSIYELPNDVVLGIRYDCILVMEPGEKYVLRKFENHQIEQIRHFPGDLRLHILGVKDPIVFKTSIAYDIRRIFQDYRAPQRHLVVSERSIEDDQGMPFSMDSERSTEDHSSAPSPLSSPAAVVQRPAPPVAAKPTPPTPQPVAAAQPPTVPPTVPPVPAKPEAPPAAAAPAASRPGPPQTTTVPPITLPPAVSEAESEDSSTYDKQSESVKSQSPTAQQGLGGFFKLKRRNQTKPADGAESGSPADGKSSLFSGFRRNNKPSPRTASPSAAQAAAAATEGGSGDDEGDMERAEDLRVSFSHIGGVGSRVSVKIGGSNPMSALQAIDESSEAALDPDAAAASPRTAAQKAAQLKNLFFRPRQQPQARKGRAAGPASHTQSGSTESPEFANVNPLARSANPMRPAASGDQAPLTKPAGEEASQPPVPRGKPTLPGLPKRLPSGPKLTAVPEAEAESAAAGTGDAAPSAAAARPPVPPMKAPAPPGVPALPVTPRTEEEQNAASKRPPPPSQPAPAVPPAMASKPVPPMPQRSPPGPEASKPKPQWPPLPAELPVKPEAAATTAAPRAAEADQTPPASASTTPPPVPVAKGRVAELAALAAARQQQAAPPEPTRPVPPARGGRVAELAAKATAAMQQQQQPSSETTPAAAANAASEESARPVTVSRSRVAELAAKATAAIQQQSGNAAAPPPVPSRPAPPARGKVAELAAKVAPPTPAAAQQQTPPAVPPPRPAAAAGGRVAQLAAGLGPIGFPPTVKTASPTAATAAAAAAAGVSAAGAGLASGSTPPVPARQPPPPAASGAAAAKASSPVAGPSKLAPPTLPLPLPGRGPPPALSKPNSPPPPPPDLHANGRPPPVPQKRRPKSVKPSSILQTPPV